MTDLKDRDIKKVFIVTDKVLHDVGYVSKVTDELTKYGIQFTIFSNVKPDPTIENVMEGVTQINAFQPDCIIGLGGGSPMDAAKVM